MAVPVEKRIALAKNEHIPKRRIGAHRSHCHLNKFVRRFLATRINSRAAPALARSDGQQAAFAKRTKQRMPCAWTGNSLLTKRRLRRRNSSIFLSLERQFVVNSARKLQFPAVSKLSNCTFKYEMSIAFCCIGIKMFQFAMM